VSRLFGTDGVRGVANTELTPELAFRIGRAGAAVLAGALEADQPIVVGRDTRLSGSMLEAAVVAGITSVGREVLLAGVVPTPAVALIARTAGAAGGVMISASHNPIEDNGIKFFAGDGFKLSDELEAAIEARLDDPDLPRPTHDGIGSAQPGEDLVDHYVGALAHAGTDLGGMTIVVDAAYGAAYRIGPEIFDLLGANVLALNAEHDGRRINVSCGATHMETVAQAVRGLLAAGEKRVFGVAFDGDADRALFVDETGGILSGDHVLMILARERKRRGALPGDAVVGTVMANLGLEQALARDGIALIRTPVGDRHVLDAMRSGNYEVGGEQSGHTIDFANNTTGDGPMTAVSLFSIVAREGGLYDLARDLHVYPQRLVNVPVRDKSVLDGNTAIARAVDDAQARLGSEGRIVVRPSGTEPVIRVMVEGPEPAEVERLADSLAARIREA
jgi:phosphoglucosamine mutase